MTRSALLAVALTTTLAALALLALPRPAAGDDGDPPTREEGLAAFKTVYEVLQHPRCLNCHPSGDRPLQSDQSRPHIMNVRRGKDGHGVVGMRCSSCHGTENGKQAGMPPGAPNWHLAPRDQAFQGLSEAELARQLKTGKFTLEKIVHHMEEDALVGWGWKPGPGRNPVSVPRARAVEALKTWVAAGAPVPPAPGPRDE